MQHDVFANPAPRTRTSYPFLVVLQADLSAEKVGRIDDITRALDWLFTGV